MKVFKLPALSLVMVLLSTGMAFAQLSPPPQKTLICLTYDDGLESHLTTVVPQLDALGLKATFFLNAIKGSAEVIGQASPALLGWKKAAQQGHELGNHTLFHPCPTALGWAKEVAIETYTAEQILQEVRIADAMLDLIDTRKTPRAFAYPCNNSLVAGQDYASQMQKEGLARYGRTGGDKNSVLKNFKNLDIMHVPSWLVEEGTTAKELIAFAEQAKAAKGMAVYQFHGIGGQFFKVSKKDHLAFLEYLQANPQHYQVIPFSEAMQLISTR